MTKQEAIQALQEGHKVTHRYFSPEEYIYIKDGKLRDENNYLMAGFFEVRIGEIWNSGWDIKVIETMQ